MPTFETRNSKTTRRKYESNHRHINLHPSPERSAKTSTSAGLLPPLFTAALSTPDTLPPDLLAVTFFPSLDAHLSTRRTRALTTLLAAFWAMVADTACRDRKYHTLLAVFSREILPLLAAKGVGAETSLETYLKSTPRPAPNDRAISPLRNLPRPARRLHQPPALPRPPDLEADRRLRWSSRRLHARCAARDQRV
ncbi:uncharacterized protein H6S33_008584 [Morchella sextelata]|uniref:uncharacterized protein n=1 Tax=Morchella sextelata TaxID=1174677 RepID=UPI001D044BD2|nr:uncharacterized protein H6S33_008584 [Morchella sextelata]KAH0602503.1 hypothetical protein H6S33_008584 [Morchella sextelata]